MEFPLVTEARQTTLKNGTVVRLGDEGKGELDPTGATPRIASYSRTFFLKQNLKSGELRILAMLNLGYKLNHALDPTDEPFRLEPGQIAKHTAIIAQSGSGKSFFLGRFVEEILLQTKANILLFDPNGDFLRVSDVESEDSWKKWKYDPVGRNGKKTHESSRTEFSDRWEQVSKRIRGGPTTDEPLSIHWPSTDGKMIASGFDTSDQYELVNCHSVVNAIGLLFSHFHASEPTAKNENLLRVCEEMLRDPAGIDDRLKEKFDIDSIVRKITTISSGSTLTSRMIDYIASTTKTEMHEAREKAVKLSRNIQEKQRDYYFRRANSIVANRIFVPDSKVPQDPEVRLDVVDISSLSEEESRQFAVNSLLRLETEKAVKSWRRAMSLPAEDDHRVPKFLVVDEAHNLMPVSPINANAIVLRDQFLTIAAEGRKYGLFLVLVSQRPDKIDPRILSECENKVVMRLGSESVLRKTSELLGLEDVPNKQLSKVLDFLQGRAVLSGSWIRDSHQFVYGGARRTVEGGKNLPDGWQQRPSTSPSPTTAKLGKAKAKASAKKRRK